MTTFGDIRSLLNSVKDPNMLDKEVIAECLADYNGPWEPILAYVPHQLLPLMWRGGNGDSQHWFEALDNHGTEPLERVLYSGDEPSIVWRSDDPLPIIEKILLPIRQEIVNRHWRPWAERNKAWECTDALDNSLSLTSSWLKGECSREQLESQRSEARRMAWKFDTVSEYHRFYLHAFLAGARSRPRAVVASMSWTYEEEVKDFSCFRSMVKIGEIVEEQLLRDFYEAK